MSYANCILYGAVLPTYGDKDKEDKKSRRKEEEFVKADDPANKERVSQLIASFR